MEDIHNYQRRLERTLESIKESKDISKHNKKIILKFYESLIIESLSVSKTQRYLYDVSRLAIWLKKNIGNATEDDLKSIIVSIESKAWTAHTKNTFKMGIRKIYRFIDKITEKGVAPERIKWMKATVKGSQLKSSEDMLTFEEVNSMISNATCKRDKAFIATLYDSGCRIGELGILKIKNITFDEHGAKIRVTGKTGPRTVRIIPSSHYLLDWVNDHPNNDVDNYIWITKKNKLMSHTRMNSILKECAKRAGIQKRIYPHLFRHSRATFLAGHLTESQMKSVLGWTPGSDMAGTYVHMNGRDSDNAILKMNGIEVDAEDEKPTFQLKKCSRCNAMNNPTSSFCNCGMVLDEIKAQEIMKIDMDRQKADEFLNKLMTNPKILKVIEDEIKL